MKLSKKEILEMLEAKQAMLERFAELTREACKDLYEEEWLDEAEEEDEIEAKELAFMRGWLEAS